MAKQKLVDLSTPMEDLIGHSGGLINEGPYKVVESNFQFYDFGRKNNDSLVLYQKLQPVDKDGEDDGDEIERRWPVGDKQRYGTVMIEPANPIKGKKGCYASIAFADSNPFDKLYDKAEYTIFVKSMADAELDMDSIGSDITTMEGNIYEYGLYTWPEKSGKTKVEEAEEGDERGGKGKKKFDGPKQTIIITGEWDGGKKSSSSKKSSKKDEADDEKPAKSSKKKPAKSEEPETAEEFLKKYLEDEVCTSDNEDDGVGHMDHKLSIPKWLDKNGCDDAKMKKAVMAIYNDVEEEGEGSLLSMLETMGWEYNTKKKRIVKGS